PVPHYPPSEYICPSLTRSLAEHGRPLIRGACVHFPALLDPIVTAPVWLVTDDPVRAYALTQGLHAAFISLAAIPAYLLCKRLGLPRWLALGVGAIAVAVPDGVYASSMLADPLAYPLVLTAVYFGVCLVDESTRVRQLAFAVTTLLLAGALLFEAAQIADTDSQRFQERYLFVLVPLLAAAFGLYVKRGLPGRIPVGLGAAGLLLVAARIPLSGYAAAHNK